MEEPTNLDAWNRALELVYSSLSAFDSVNLGFTGSLNDGVINIHGKLVTTTTSSLVKTSV